MAAGICLVLSYFLIRLGRDWPAKISLAIFAFACIFLLSMSGTYHLLPRDSAGRAVLARLDHAGIFLLIAGTFTPIHVILFKGWKRWLPLTLVWTAAITGITLKSIFFSEVSEGLGLTFYLSLGWLGIASIILLCRDYGWSAIELPAVAALAYTVGALLEYCRWPVILPGVVGPHELFHAAVLVGVASFWKFIREIASGELVHEKSPPALASGLEIV